MSTRAAKRNLQTEALLRLKQCGRLQLWMKMRPCKQCPGLLTAISISWQIY